MAVEPSPKVSPKPVHRLHERDGRGAAATKPTEPSEHTKPGNGLYANCDEEERAEEAPLHRGQHGYGPERDGLGDGVACVG
jgi:hypothetical protein